MVPGLLRGQVLVQVQVQVLARTKAKFVRQSKLANDPLPMPAANCMSRSALLAGKVVDIVCGWHTKRIYAVLGRVVRTGRLEIPNPRDSKIAIARYMAGR